MRLTLLGPARARRDGEEIVLGPPKQRAVLGVLAGRLNEVVEVDRIVEGVWGADAPTSAAGGVHTYVAGLRRTLEPERTRPSRGGVLESTGRGYVLRLAPERVDVAVFERLLALAGRKRGEGCSEEALRAYDAALALWSGPAYGGVPGPHAEQERTRLQALRIEAVEEWTSVMLALGRHADVLGVLPGYVAQEPLREKLRWLLMLALYRSDRRAHAFEVYQETHRLLAQELGIEPGAELRRLHARIRAEDPELRLPGPDRAPAVPFARRPARSAPAPAGPDRAAAVAALRSRLPARPRGFVGREEQIAAVRRHLLRGRDAGTAISVVEGPPGVGKTALALHVAHRLAAEFPDGRLFVDLGACGSGKHPLGTMEALAQLLRSLGVTGALPVELPARTALLRSLLHGRRVLLVLDDAPDAEQLRALLPHGPSGVLVTSRRRQSGLVVREGAHAVRLAPLTEQESARLLCHLVGEERVRGDRTSVARLVEQCARLPLALHIVGEVLVAHPELSLAELADAQGTERNRLARATAEDEVLPPLRAAFATSYRALPAQTAHVFRLLGLHDGPVITAGAAAALTGWGRDTVRRHLDVLAENHLLVEDDDATYRFPSLIGCYATECAEEEPSVTRAAALRRLAQYRHTSPRLPRAKAG
ncbi:BTAD domain-containing putative transcriptional regulator [Streptomyces sp. NPDC058794]|uniref:AfsR/SARP family transcriptional regulator n=1 Tax=unclassified Streptomyces TaxID=2593676 RepID=UPI0036BCD375